MSTHQYIIVKHTPAGDLFLTGFSEVGGVWQPHFDNAVFIHHNRSYVKELVIEYNLGCFIEVRGRKTPENFAKTEVVKANKKTITAINPKYQTAVNKSYKALRAYYNCVDADGTFNTDREQLANERKQEKQYNVYFNTFGDMPKREQTNFDKQHSIIHGYKG